jgi:hypothetical protein
MYFSSSPAPSYAGAAAEDYKTTVKSSNSQAKSLPLHNSYASQQPSKEAYASPKSSYDIQAGSKSSYEDYLVPKSSYEALASPKSSYGAYGKPKISAEYSTAVLPPHLAGSATKQYAATQPPVTLGARYPSLTSKEYTVSKYSLTVTLLIFYNSLLMLSTKKQRISFSLYERSAKFSSIIKFLKAIKKGDLSNFLLSKVYVFLCRVFEVFNQRPNSKKNIVYRTLCRS